MGETKEKNSGISIKDSSTHIHKGVGMGSGAVYGLGLIGVFIYYLQQATSLGMGVLGFLKALVWPAILLYNIFKMLKL